MKPFDALCLQEISFDNANKLAKSLEMINAAGNVSLPKGVETNTCTTAVLLSKDCELIDFKWLKRPGEPKPIERVWRRNRNPRYHSVATINLRGVRLNVASIHLGASISGTEQKEQLDKVITKLEDEELPFVATGDTNGVDDSKYTKTYRILPQTVTYFPQCTEHDFLPFRMINQHIRTPQEYDRAYSNLVSDKAGTVFKTEGFCPTSDHVPVMFRFFLDLSATTAPAPSTHSDTLTTHTSPIAQSVTIQPLLKDAKAARAAAEGGATYQAADEAGLSVDPSPLPDPPHPLPMDTEGAAEALSAEKVILTVQPVALTQAEAEKAAAAEKEAAEKARREAEEKARREAEEQARREAAANLEMQKQLEADTKVTKKSLEDAKDINKTTEELLRKSAAEAAAEERAAAERAAAERAAAERAAAAEKAAAERAAAERAAEEEATAAVEAAEEEATAAVEAAAERATATEAAMLKQKLRDFLTSDLSETDAKKELNYFLREKEYDAEEVESRK